MVRLSLDKRALDGVVAAAVRDEVSALQRVLDTVYRRHEGKPVGQVEQALIREVRGVRSFSPSRSTIREWAGAISSGTRVVFRG